MTRLFDRQVAIVASASFETPSEPARNEVEMLLPVIHHALGKVGLTQRDIGFTVSGSSDYLQGFPFAFVGALDAVGAWPPIRESHLEMDGAFALAEAVEVLQHGSGRGDQIDTALVYAFARPSRGELDRTLAIQLDPYSVAPLWPDARGLAGLQAQAMRDSGRFADVPDVPATYVADGATAVILAVGDRARELTSTPAWIRGIDHRIESPALGGRDLTVSTSTATAARHAGVDGVDAAWLHVLYPHQELLLRDALGLNGQPVHTAAGPMMVGGLERLAAAAAAVGDGRAERAVAHATSGPCLQQNLVAVLDGEAA
jgi:hypothetical protein